MGCNRHQQGRLGGAGRHASFLWPHTPTVGNLAPIPQGIRYALRTLQAWHNTPVRSIQTGFTYSLLAAEGATPTCSFKANTQSTMADPPETKKITNTKRQKSVHWASLQTTRNTGRKRRAVGTTSRARSSSGWLSRASCHAKRLRNNNGKLRGRIVCYRPITSGLQKACMPDLLSTRDCEHTPRSPSRPIHHHLITPPQSASNTRQEAAALACPPFTAPAHKQPCDPPAPKAASPTTQDGGAQQTPTNSPAEPMNPQDRVRQQLAAQLSRRIAHGSGLMRTPSVSRPHQAGHKRAGLTSLR